MEILKLKKKKPVPETQNPPKTTSESEEKLLSNPSNELAEISDSERPENYYYQAIGWILATVSKTEESQLQVTFEDGNSLGLTGEHKLLSFLYKQIEESPDRPLWLLCYPKFNIQEKVLSFKVVKFQKERPEGEEPGLFILRGVWHFIKFNPHPVFSIYRNQLKAQGDRVKNNHLPLVGLDETPYHKEKEPPIAKKFYQIEARLNSALGCFEWVRNLAEPFNPPPPKLEKTAKFKKNKPAPKP